MNIRHGNGTTQYGRGVSIYIQCDEVARAILAWVVSQGVHIDGPLTITVNGELIDNAKIYVDPSGFVVTDDGRRMDGSVSNNLRD